MAENIKTRKIMLSGGGSGGPVAPLLVLAEELLKDNSGLEIIFVGTSYGPERKMISTFSEHQKKIKFIPIISGKWRRYFSIYNFLDVFKIIMAFFQSLFILLLEKPNLVISAGGFVSVPLVWAAHFINIPILIHQQDVRPGLANRLMSKMARVITVTFEKSLLDYGAKAVLVGNPTKKIIINENNGALQELREKYHLDKNQAFLFIFGGMTGALGINNLVFKSRDELIKQFQIIHLCGRGKFPHPESKNYSDYQYQVFESLNNNDFLSLISIADLIVSRAGLGSLSDLSVLEKPAIIIPIPDSHQEDNAEMLTQTGAALVLSQKELTPEKFVLEIEKLFVDKARQERMRNNIKKIIKPGAGEKLAGIVWEIINTK